MVDKVTCARLHGILFLQDSRTKPVQTKSQEFTDIEDVHQQWNARSAIDALPDGYLKENDIDRAQIKSGRFWVEVQGGGGTWARYGGIFVAEPASISVSA